jgi:predicted alpha/beta-fold hydrolase
MPNIPDSNYSNKPKWMFNEHIETIFPALFRKVRLKSPERIRIKTHDDDFLDIDHYAQKSNKCVVISHGLEGSSTRAYVKGMARAFFRAGWDVVAWNFRSCSGEMNHRPFFYHSGATYDLETVLSHFARKYFNIALVGFSLGGNMTLKFLGEPASRNFPQICGSVVFSVPLELSSSSRKISLPGNRVYANRFLRSLKRKIRLKAQKFPVEMNPIALNNIKTLQGFDDQYTGPLHGFRDAEDYYHSCSSIHFLRNIQVPALIVNAANDPFLSEKCYPHSLTNELEMVFLEVPDYGGHVGFYARNKSRDYWSEIRAVAFL